MGIFIRGPADDVEIMRVTEAMQVAAGVEQSAYDFDVAGRCGPVQRVRVISGLACVWIRSMLEQQSHGVRVTGSGCSV